MPRPPNTHGGRRSSAGRKPAEDGLRAAILQYPHALAHAEVHRRLTAAGVEVTLRQVQRVRAAKWGGRKPGRPEAGTIWTEVRRLRLARERR